MATIIHPFNLAFGCIKMNFLWMKLEHPVIKRVASPISIINWNLDASAKWRTKKHHIEIHNLTDDFLPVMMFRTWEKNGQLQIFYETN